MTNKDETIKTLQSTIETMKKTAIISKNIQKQQEDFMRMDSEEIFSLYKIIAIGALGYFTIGSVLLFCLIYQAI